MKKKLVALAAAVATLALSAVMLAGRAGGGDAQSADSAATDGSFTLAVGFDQGYPPYGYVGDDGQFTGFDLELAKAVCEKMGWELKLEPIDWDAKDALIGSGTIALIFAIRKFLFVPSFGEHSAFHEEEETRAGALSAAGAPRRE